MKISPYLNIWKNINANKALLDHNFQQKLALLNTNFEKQHSGEIMIVIEKSLGWKNLIFDQNPAERALELFSLCRVWDTHKNNGVLIYVAINDHYFHIVADRGINALVQKKSWSKICQKAINKFKANKWQQAIEECLKDVATVLIKNFPDTKQYDNELSDKPIII